MEKDKWVNRPVDASCCIKQWEKRLNCVKSSERKKRNSVFYKEALSSSESLKGAEL